MGDVDPTGDRVWRGDADTMPEFFADLRHEVDLAARRYAELSAHADRLVAERDRLRAVVDAVLAMWDDLTAVDEDGTHYQFPAAHYAPIDDGLDALGLLDVSPAIGDHSAQKVGQRFLSNACIHEEHDQCEQECPFCNDSCGCPCHATPDTGGEPDD